ncbi:sensor histidine kinase [Streptomyces sp. NBC_00038]|uniref:sensor histidine kinase n=1 Tax=Streptomyces sp. NBC_00038 TaxID=2903615 RepID=UPI00224D5E2D|nr:histidine kinase [Streptomyces sp. NBC_00038]MCX5559183.1 histidine kinase [Streptomyces sp. NBC_00038]
MRDAPNDQGAGPAGPAGLTGQTGLTGFHRYTWWSLIGTTEFFLVFFVGEWVLDPDVAAWARIPGAVGLAATAVASAVLLSRRVAIAPAGAPDSVRERPPVAWLTAGSAGAALLGGVALAVRNYELWSYAPATMVTVAATFLSPRRRRELIAGAVAVAAVLGGAVALACGDGPVQAAAFPAVMVASVAWITLGMLWGWDVAGRLNRARGLAAELAVKDERLRFAADLHDIQGHHLQVIALKGELAARLVEADPARAAAEMKDVQRLATDALTDTRAVVQGYRRTSLDAEITNAARVLAAADIDARLHIEPADAEAGFDADSLPPAGRHLLGLVMREATTNVLRHSQARRAEVDYRLTNGFARLRVSNDGAAGPPRSGMDTGTGLRTLAERLEAAGGELTWEHKEDSFMVAASLPVEAGAHVDSEGAAG